MYIWNIEYYYIQTIILVYNVGIYLYCIESINYCSSLHVRFVLYCSTISVSISVYHSSLECAQYYVYLYVHFF